MINFFLVGYVCWTWAELNGAVCRDARAEWRPPKGGATVRWQPHSTLSGMFVQPFYFVSYYFSWIEYDDFFFNFQETYNSRLKERYGDNLSTHPDFDPDLWMEVGSSGGPDKNRVYELSNTMAKNLGRPVVSQLLGAPHQYQAPILRSSWPWNNNTSDSWRIMNIRSQMGDPCAPSFWPFSPGNNQPPPLASPLF